MKLRAAFVQDIFNVKTARDFDSLALELFHYQYHNVLIYKQFCDLLSCKPEKITSWKDIPFMPVDFFRSHRISDQENKAALVFSSSGTTDSAISFHEVPFPAIYESSFSKGFQHFYGDIKSYCILALLPSYLERKGSSLVYMADKLIKDSTHPLSGFYLNELEKLYQQLQMLKKQQQKTILLGVTYALLDLAALVCRPANPSVNSRRSRSAGRTRDADFHVAAPATHLLGQLDRRWRSRAGIVPDHGHFIPDSPDGRIDVDPLEGPLVPRP